MSSPRSPLRRRRAARQRLMGGWALFGVAALVGGLVGLTAANTVSASKIDLEVLGVTVNDIAPAECLPETRTYTNIVAGTTGTAAADLILGTSAGETIRGGDGDDCLLGGGGNDNLGGQGGNDRCIGGPGSDTNDSFLGLGNTCEYFQD